MKTASLPCVRGPQAAVRPLLAVLLLLTAALPARADDPNRALPLTGAGTETILRSHQAAPDLGTSPVLLGEGTGWRSYFSGLNNRSRIIQFCIVIMSLALFILMRKLDESGPRRRNGQRGEAAQEGRERAGPHATAE